MDVCKGVVTEERGEGAYNVELAAPVLMESELERPNAIAEEVARRLAPLSAGFAIVVVSLLLHVRVC